VLALAPSIKSEGTALTLCIEPDGGRPIRSMNRYAG
jgi:hypothetical protein